MFKRRVEMRVVKDTPEEFSNGPIEIDSDTLKELVAYGVASYGIIKAINLTCNIVQHVVVRSIP